MDALEGHVLVDDFFIPPTLLVASLISMSPYGNSGSLVAGCPLHCMRQPGKRYIQDGQTPRRSCEAGGLVWGRLCIVKV